MNIGEGQQQGHQGGGQPKGAALTGQLDPFILFLALNSDIVKRQIRSVQFTADTIDTIGNRYLEFTIPIKFAPDIPVNAPDIKHIRLLGHGGGLAAGELAIVGDRGPELFAPSSAGQVVPMRDGGMLSLLNALSAGGDSSSSFKNYGTLTLAADGGQGADMIRTIMRSLS